MNNSSIFFVDKKRNKYSFNEFPEAIYIDTCFWVEALGQNYSEFGRDCKNFIDDCLSRDEMIVCSSNLVLQEVDFTVKNKFLKKLIDSKKYDSKIVRCSDGKINSKATYANIVVPDQSLVTQLDNEIEKFREFIRNNSYVIPHTYDDELREKIERISKDTSYLVLGTDVEHIAIAHSNGINSIATVDSDYWATDNMNIYTIPSDNYRRESWGRANSFLEFDENKI